MLIHRWWRLPLENDIIKDGRIVECSGWLTRCYRGVANCRSVINYVGVSRQSHITAVISTPVDSLGEREQMAWLSGTMARELEWIRTPCASITAKIHSVPPISDCRAKQRAGNAAYSGRKVAVHVSAITPDASALQRFLPFFLLISNVWPGVITNSGCGRRV